jgi:enoyl-CoA hydratase/carnithine racemase
MAAEKIQVEVVGKVGILKINNPPVNAMSDDVKIEFQSEFSEISNSDDIWTLIITGVGEKTFAAGANIPALLELDPISGLKRVRDSRKFYNIIACCEKPVIAAINGLCLGGGLELALLCDIRIAAEHAKLGVPEVNLGLMPGAGGTQRLPRLIGPGWANYLLFTGEPISAQKAMEIGLVNQVVAHEDLMKTALEIANRINSKAPLAVRAAKKASSTGLQKSLEEGLDTENEIWSELCATWDKKEGITAFLEKRKPQFQGR